MSSIRESILSVFESKVYYRCTTDSDEHISTGIPEWDDNLFVSSSLELAKAYGDHIEVIKPKPNAKIIHEGDPKLKVRMRKGERYIDYLLRCLKSAKDLGYDIIEFKRQGDVGTIIMNPDSVVRGLEESVMNKLLKSINR